MEESENWTSREVGSGEGGHVPLVPSGEPAQSLVVGKQGNRVMVLVS